MHTIDRMATRLLLKTSLSESLGIQTNILKVRAETYDAGKAKKYRGLCVTPGGECPLCGGDHSAKWYIADLFPSLHVGCTGGKSRSFSHHKDLARILFVSRKEHEGTGNKVELIERSDDEKDCTQPTGNRRMRQKRGDHRPKGNPGRIRDDLKVMTWNTDGRSNPKGRKGGETFASFMEFITSEGIDIANLQEVAGMEVDHRTLAQEYGYNMYQHRKVAILVCQRTAQTIMNNKKIWYSEEYDSMGITLNMGPRNEQTCFIGNGYLPTNIDSLPKHTDDTRYSKAMDQHMELNARSMEHDHSILSMDANETTTPYGRITTYKARGVDENEITATGKNRSQSDTTMACYSENFLDAHEHQNPSQYMHGEINGPAYTHEQPLVGGKLSKSKLDYMYITFNMASSIRECSIKDNPKFWSGHAPSNNFHTTIITTLQWNWPTERKDPKEGLKGTELPLTINMNNLDEGKADTIAREVHISLGKRWREIKGVKKGRLPPLKKATILNDILHQVINKIAIHHLGTTDPTEVGPTKRERQEATLDRWDTFHTEVGKWLLTRTEGEEVNALGQSMQDMRKVLQEEGVNIPMTTHGLRKWWQAKDLHRSSVLGMSRELGMSDKKTLKNRKAFYNQFAQRGSSLGINVLRDNGKYISSDVGIEKACTDYIKNIAEAPTKDAKRKLQAHPIERRTDEHFRNLLDSPKFNEMRDCIQSMNSQSSATDINPALLKICTIRTWKEWVKKSKTEMRRELYQAKQNRYNADVIRWSKGNPERIPIAELNLEARKEIGKVKQVEIVPFYGLHMATYITALCLEARDIPDSEKIGIITPIPKTQGQINSMDTIRPITVGPIMGRLVHKILAGRLGSVLSEHNLIDPAQFAFLRGKNIHEPINSVLHCYRQAIGAEEGTDNKACYAIFYDISKAYDTLGWGSIERALKRIGVGQDFVDMAMNALKGTKLAMKTNIKGRITPRVEMHKAIKQGCPLAPLLFAIVMDELHAGYREIFYFILFY